MSQSQNLKMLYVPVPDEICARKISKVLVEQGLAVCTNVIVGMQSTYIWQGALHQDRECILIVKTRIDQQKKAVETVKGLHPYEVPCILSWGVDIESEKYAAWTAKV